MHVLEIRGRPTTVVDQQAELIDLEKDLFGAALDDIMSGSQVENIQLNHFGLARDNIDPGSTRLEGSQPLPDDLDTRPSNHVGTDSGSTETPARTPSSSSRASK